jgi:predicted chitinase
MVYKLPSGDGGGTYEVAGINDRYHPKAAAQLKAMIQRGEFAAAKKYASEYLAQYTDSIASKSNIPAIQFYLRDSTFNRGPAGATKILQKALGLGVDGKFGDGTAAALKKAEENPEELLNKMRASREWYERVFAKRDESSKFWKGLVNRWNNALRDAKVFGFTPVGKEDAEEETKTMDDPATDDKDDDDDSFSNVDAAMKAIGIPEQKRTQYEQDCKNAMKEAGINTVRRIAAFLAQVAHESGNLRYFKELASGRAYEGRRDLGNVNPGDGVKYKGRGPIQVTGRNNYAAAGKALGLDLINKPELAERGDVGFRLAAWFWNTRSLNKFADQGPSGFDTITKRINGGFNGKADRDAKYRAACKALGGC